MLIRILGVLKIPGPNKKQGITYEAAKGLIRYFYSGKQSHLKNPYDCMYILVNSGNVPFVLFGPKPEIFIPIAQYLKTACKFFSGRVC